MDRRLEVEQLRRSIAMLSPGARDALAREDTLRLLAELGATSRPASTTSDGAARAGRGRVNLCGLHRVCRLH